MKKYKIIFTISALIVFYSNILSQDLAPLPNYDSFSKTFNSKKNQTIELNSRTKNSVVTALFHDGIHSRHSAPQSLFRYARCYFLILSSEMQISGFPSNVNITSLGYNYKYGTDLSTKGYFKVYFQNTADVVNNKSTNWNSAIQQMTIVHSDTLQILTKSGIFDIPLNASENFTYTGAGIYVAFEYSNPTGPLAVVSNVAWANKVLPNPILKSSQTDDSLRVIATGSSNLRPETRFGCKMTDIVIVGPVYSMGVMGISPGIDTNFVKAVVNHTRDAEDTIIVTTTVKKVVNGFIKHIFTDTVISSSVETKVLNHNYFINDDLSVDSIIVTAIASGEEITGNNKAIYLNQITVNSWNHYIPSITPSGGAGLSVGTGDYVARFHTPSCLPLCAVDMSFYAETNQGSNPYEVVIYAADGTGGLPGTLLHISPARITPSAFTGAIKRSTYFLPEPLIICSGYYYAGYSQTAPRNLRVSYQIETPIRTGEFYYTEPAGAGNWIEFAEISPYKIDVAPRTYLSLNMKLYLEGFYNGDRMISDTIKILVRSQTSPYITDDSALAVLDSNGKGIFNFINVNSDSCYYYEVKHRNHIRTFSHSLCQKLDGAPAIYDFTSSASKAFGNNMIFIPGQFSTGGYAIYSGDINQDGIIDATDASAIENDAANFVTGYVNTDLTGDNITDASDAAIVDNNAANFVSVVRP